MRFVRTGKDATNTISQFLSGQRPVRFQHLSFAMHPLRLDWIQPGALNWQVAKQDTDTLSALFDLPVVLMDPGSYHLANMPRSIIPNQDQHPEVHFSHFLTCPLQKLDRNCTNRIPWPYNVSAIRNWANI